MEPISDKQRPNVIVRHGGKAAFIETNFGGVHFHASAQIDGRRSPLSTLPPRPNFIERPEVVEPLIHSLLKSSPRSGPLAVQGMSGVGKTFAALGVCYDARVREAFSDGIVWLTFGHKPVLSIDEQLSRVCTALNGNGSASHMEDQYRSLLQEKSVLIVLDDLWDLKSIQPFLIEADRSRILYTTRDRTLAAQLDGKEHDLDLLDEQTARSFLSKWSSRPLDRLVESAATRIITHCGGLVLALAMVGSLLRGKPPDRWAAVAGDLEKARIKYLKGRRPGLYQYDSLHASFAVSVDALASQIQASYLLLALLVEGMTAPTELLRYLWGGDNDSILEKMGTLVDRSLATWSSEASIKLHNLQIEFLQQLSTFPEDLAQEQESLTLALPVVQKRPAEFGPQIAARLARFSSKSWISELLEKLKANAPPRTLWPIESGLSFPGGILKRVLDGHSGDVMCVALTPDGEQVVAGCEDGSVWVWSVTHQTSPKILSGHTDTVRSVAVSADGAVIISGSDDSTVRIWYPSKLEMNRTFVVHDSSVRAVGISADGTRVVFGGEDCPLNIWDLDSENAHPKKLSGPSETITSVALSANGDTAVAGSLDTSLHVWNLKSSEPPLVLRAHSERVITVSLSPDGRFLASAALDDIIMVHDLRSAKKPVFTSSHNHVMDVAISEDGRVLVSSGEDFKIRVWRLGEEMDAQLVVALDGTNPRILMGHTATVIGVAATPDCRRIASAGRWDKTVRIWNPKGVEESAQNRHHAEVWSIHLSSDGMRALTHSRDTTLRIWDVGRKHSEGYHLSRFRVGCVAMTEDGKNVLLGGSDGVLRLWNLKKNSTRICLYRKQSIQKAAISADQRTAVFSCDDNSLNVIDLGKFWNNPYLDLDISKFSPTFGLHGDPLQDVIEQPDYPIRAVCISADSERIGYLCASELIVLDRSPRRRRTFTFGGSGANDAAFSRDGRFVVCGGHDGLLSIINLESETPTRLIVQQESIQSIALSPDGSFAFTSGGDDFALRVWDLDNGECVATFSCDARISSCAVAQNRAAIADLGGGVHFLSWPAIELRSPETV